MVPSSPRKEKTAMTAEYLGVGNWDLGRGPHGQAGKQLPSPSG